MSQSVYKIREFLGIQQQKDGALLDSGSAADALNMTTDRGNLSPVFVDWGNARYRPFPPLSPDDSIIGFFAYKVGDVVKAYAVTNTTLYICEKRNGILNQEHSWVDAYSFSEIHPYLYQEIPCSSAIVKINNVYYVLITNGNSSDTTIKVSFDDDTVESFGTGVYSFNGTNSGWDGTSVITVNGTLSSEAQRHALLDGVVFCGSQCSVSAVTSTTITISSLPTAQPDQRGGDTLTIRGGVSDTDVKYVTFYSGRLFAANDSAYPDRLYWSCVEGDGRTIEDWYSVDGSADASGGYVNVGNGETITALVSLQDWLLIITNKSIWRLYGDKPSEYTLQYVCNNEYQIMHGSIAVHNGVPYTVSHNGIMYFDGNGWAYADGANVIANSKFLGLVGEYIHVPIRAMSCFHKLYFVCGYYTFSRNVIVYDTERNTTLVFGGKKRYYGIEFYSFTNEILTLCNIPNTNYSEYPYSAFIDFLNGDGTAYWKTQLTDLGYKYNLKQIRRIVFRASGKPFSLTVKAGNAERTYTIDPANMPEGYVDLNVSAPPARRFQLIFTAIDSGVFTIEGGVDILFDVEVKA
jgi:hypothetical protein